LWGGQELLFAGSGRRIDNNFSGGNEAEEERYLILIPNVKATT
jgi:hypothetical protein